MPRKRRQTARDGDDGDPLGTLIQQYRVSLAGVLIVGGMVALIGLGLLAFGLTRKAHSLVFLLGGALTSLVFLVVILGSLHRLRRHLAPSPLQPRAGTQPAGQGSQRAMALYELEH